MQRVVIFDLDGTTIDSAHRTPKMESGHTILPEYLRLKTRENVFKDALLPLAKQMKKMYEDIGTYVVVCTSRVMEKDDFDYLKAKGIHYNKMYSRPENCTEKDGKLKRTMFNKFLNLKQFKNIPVYFFDDMAENINTGRTYKRAGSDKRIITMNANFVNKKLTS